MSEKREKRKVLKGTLLGGFLTALVLAGVFGAGFLLGPVGLNGAFASTPGQTATNNQPAAASTNANHHDKQYYMDLVEQSFASNLGVDKAKLDSALAAAVAATADQAVQNGDISAAQATGLKAAAGKGLGTFVETVANTDGATSKVADPNTDELMNAAFNEAAKKLNFPTRDELMSALKQGRQSLADLAPRTNMTAKTLQDAMLQAAKAAATANVASGKWTQAQADDAYSNATNVIAKMMNAQVGSDNNGPADELVQAGFHAGGQLLGLSNPDDIGMFIKRDNKSLAQIAQEHNLTLDNLRNAILQAARTKANEMVSSGKWTQTQADEAYNSFNNLVTKLSAGPLTGTNPGASAPSK